MRDQLLEPALADQQIDAKIENRQRQIDRKLPKPQVSGARPFIQSHEAVVVTTYIVSPGETGLQVSDLRDVSVTGKRLKVFRQPGVDGGEKAFLLGPQCLSVLELAFERFGGEPVRPIVVAVMQAVRRKGPIFPSHVGKKRGQANDQLIGTAYERMFERQGKKALGHIAMEA